MATGKTGIFNAQVTHNLQCFCLRWLPLPFCMLI